jgi:hypothetical protein
MEAASIRAAVSYWKAIRTIYGLKGSRRRETDVRIRSHQQRRRILLK